MEKTTYFSNQSSFHDFFRVVSCFSLFKKNFSVFSFTDAYYDFLILAVFCSRGIWMIEFFENGITLKTFGKSG